MATKHTLPTGEELEQALTAWQESWNEAHAEDQVSISEGGLSAEKIAAFLADQVEAVAAGGELTAEVSAAAGTAGVELPAVGAGAVGSILTTWNAAAPAESAAAPKAAAAAAPVPPKPATDVAAAAAAAAARDAAEHKAKMDAEGVRFGRLNDNFRNQDFFKNKVKRTGWTKPLPGYSPCCCGNSAADIGYILLCFLALYIFVGLFFWVMMEFALQTDDSNTALWIFTGLLVALWISILGTAFSGPAHNEDVREQLEAKAAAKLAAAGSASDMAV